MAGDEALETALEWGIKESLIRYVASMADGSVTAHAPAQAIPGGFSFPASRSAPTDGSLWFSGSVTLSGHGGMLKLQIEDPWLSPGPTPSDPWTLTINDPYEAGARIAFASIERLDFPERSGGPEGADSNGANSNSADSNGAVSDGAILATASGTTLTEDGADLFFSGPYTAGTALDDPRIIAAAVTQNAQRPEND